MGAERGGDLVEGALEIVSSCGERPLRVELADELLAVGLPVVDGTHFQAPGRARLPFGGADEARPALERALALWAASRGPEQPVRKAPDLP